MVSNGMSKLILCLCSKNHLRKLVARFSIEIDAISCKSTGMLVHFSSEDYVNKFDILKKFLDTEGIQYTIYPVNGTLLVNYKGGWVYETSMVRS